MIGQDCLRPHELLALRIRVVSLLSERSLVLSSRLPLPLSHSQLAPLAFSRAS